MKLRECVRLILTYIDIHPTLRYERDVSSQSQVANLAILAAIRSIARHAAGRSRHKTKGTLPSSVSHSKKIICAPLVLRQRAPKGLPGDRHDIEIAQFPPMLLSLVYWPPQRRTTHPRLLSVCRSHGHKLSHKASYHFKECGLWKVWSCPPYNTRLQRIDSVANLSR